MDHAARIAHVIMVVLGYRPDQNINEIRVTLHGSTIDRRGGRELPGFCRVRHKIARHCRGRCRRAARRRRRPGGAISDRGLRGRTRHCGARLALAAILRRLCAEQLLVASATTEGKAGGNVRSSEAPVEHRDGRISLNRAATVISYGASADGIVTTARRAPDAAPSDQVLIAFLKSDYTLTRLQGWNTLGMRGTCSDGYTLQATGTPDQILPEPYETIHAHTMVPTAHLLWGSVWTGIAACATERAQAFIRQAVRQSGGQAPPGAPQFTKALATLRTLRGMLASALRTYTE